MDVLVFILVLSVLVVVHEWGHFITARLLGVRVEKFSVGFGPKLFSRKRGDTEYMVCAIPLGGYVKMAGDERAACKGDKDEFFSHPVGHRALIVLMGPMVNMVFAYICFYFIFLLGYPTLAAKIGKVLEDHPAAAAGLLPGDRVTRIDDKAIVNWEDLHKYVSTSGGQTLHFTIVRDGQEIAKEIAPKIRSVENIFGQKESVRLVGIQPAEEIVFFKYGPGQSFVKAYEHLTDLCVLMFKALYHVVTGAMPAQDALGGPLRIFDVVKQAASLGWAYLVITTAIISANLAIFNLFPVPVLDGGHLMLLAVEKVRGRPLSLKVEEHLTRAGLTLLLCLVVFVIYSDIDHLGWIDKLKNFWPK